MTGKSPTEMATMLVRGDGRALWEIIAAYKLRLVNYFFKQLGDRHVAEDLAQEVFLRVYRKADSFKPGRPFEPWLFSIARNLVIDNHRKTARHFKAMATIDEGGRVSVDPSQTIERRELASIVQKEIRNMPEKYRSALVFCEMEGFSYDAAAAALGVSSKTVGARLSRAREYLRQRLKKYTF